MLSETLFRVPREPGLHVLQGRGVRGARELTSSRLCLHAGSSAQYVQPDEETVIVLQQGGGTFVTSDHTWPVSRESVFTERATALYLPPGVPLTVTADSTLEAVLVSTPSSGGGRVALVGPDDVTVNARGRGTYAREVHDLFVRDPYAKRLMVGETFNPPGHWSSFPPHKHDGRNGEAFLEEVYHYRVSPAHGFGHQRLYTEDGLRLSPGLGATWLRALLSLGPGGRPAAADVVRGPGASLDSRSSLIGAPTLFIHRWTQIDAD